MTPLQSAFFPYSYLIIHRNIWSTVLIDVSDYITFLAINSFVPLSSHNLLCGLSLFLLDTLRNYLLLRKKCVIISYIYLGLKLKTSKKDLRTIGDTLKLFVDTVIYILFWFSHSCCKIISMSDHDITELKVL